MKTILTFLFSAAITIVCFSQTTVTGAIKYNRDSTEIGSIINGTSWFSMTYQKFRAQLGGSRYTYAMVDGTGILTPGFVPVATGKFSIGNSSMQFNSGSNLLSVGNISTGNITLSGSMTGNSSSATILQTGRTIGMSGDVNWTSPSFNGSSNVTAAATVTRINGIALSGLGTGILKNTTGTGVLSIAIASDFPTLNQNTTGSAATWTTGRTIGMTGDVTWTSPSLNGSANVTAAATVSRINGVALSGLGTGILKNTTGTGAPSIAVAADFPTLNQNTTGSAATLTTARTINGVSFNGSANITVPADASTLTNTTLASGVVNSSLTSLGILGSLNMGGNYNQLVGGFTFNNGSGDFNVQNSNELTLNGFSSIDLTSNGFINLTGSGTNITTTGAIALKGLSARANIDAALTDAVATFKVRSDDGTLVGHGSGIDFEIRNSNPAFVNGARINAEATSIASGGTASMNFSTLLNGTLTERASLDANGLNLVGTITASNFSGSSSGTNTGDQTTITGNAGSATILQTGRTIGMTGDVLYTSPSFNGSGNVTATATIQDNSVDNTDLADMVTASFKGRNTAGTGDPEDLSIATAKTMLNLTGTNSGDQTITLTGDVTGSGTGSFAATIASNAVTNTKAADMATQTFKGRTTAGTGDPEDLTATQATAMLNTFTTTLKGLVPPPATVTGKVLSDNGTWISGAGISNSAVANELMMSNGTNAVPSGLSTGGTIAKLELGLATTAGTSREITAQGSSTNIALALSGKGTGAVNLTSGDQLSSFAVGNSGVTATSNTNAFNFITTSIATNQVQEVMQLVHNTSSAPAVGIGTRMSFVTEVAGNVQEIGGSIESVSTDIGAASEDFDLVFKNMSNGAIANEKFRITSDGRIYGTALHNNAGSLTGPTNQYIASGTYTPTTTNTANLSTTTPVGFTYTRIGNLVTVNGRIDAAISGVGLGIFTISLPPSIAENLVNSGELTGIANGIHNGSTVVSGVVREDVTNDRAIVTFTAASVASATLQVNFTYLIQ